MMQLLVSTLNGEEHRLSARRGETLAQSIFLSGEFAVKPLCSGLGHCGLCRVQFVSEPPPPLPEDEQILGVEAVNDGWRLGCRHKVLADCHVRMDVNLLNSAPAARQAKPSAKAKEKKLRLAVDLGTTSLLWSALAVSGKSSETFSPVCSGKELNPQMGAGSDVLSRLAAALAPDGEKRLQTLTLAALRRIIADLPGPVEEICLAGNTAMIALTRGASVLGLASAPYSLEFRGNHTENLPGLPPIYFPPQVSPFIGSDISAGMALLLDSKPAYPFLLADLGTNGEFVLALSAKRSLAVSVPLGPALEGIGLSYGALAGVGGEAGVITGFETTPQGLRPMPESPAPLAAYTGISGTGYLSLHRQLRQLKIIGDDGRFNTDGLPPLARKITAGLHNRSGQLELQLVDNLSLTGTDVEEILKVKAAFSLAVDTLLDAARLAPKDLSACFLAGALGQYVNLEDLYGLGFLPDSLPQKNIRILGNTALAGAELLLGSPQARDSAVAWAKSAYALNLTADKAFMTRFLKHMQFNFPPSDRHE